MAEIARSIEAANWFSVVRVWVIVGSLVQPLAACVQITRLEGPVQISPAKSHAPDCYAERVLDGGADHPTTGPIENIL
jgi:hypothetical protein